LECQKETVPYIEGEPNAPTINKEFALADEKVSNVKYGIRTIGLEYVNPFNIRSVPIGVPVPNAHDALQANDPTALPRLYDPFKALNAPIYQL
jgi:hypothetical protein